MPEPKTQETAKPSAPPEYKQPSIYVGEYVYWSFHRSSEKYLALVTSITPRMINVTVVMDGQPGVAAKRGVRHATDPDLGKMIENPGGVWDYTELGRKLHALLD